METSAETQKTPSPLLLLLQLLGLVLLQAGTLWLVTKIFPSVPCNTAIAGDGCLSTPTFTQQLISGLVGVVFVPFAIGTAQRLWSAVRSVRPIARWLAILVGVGMTAWICWQSLVMWLALIGRFFSS